MSGDLDRVMVALGRRVPGSTAGLLTPTIIAEVSIETGIADDRIWAILRDAAARGEVTLVADPFGPDNDEGGAR